MNSNKGQISIHKVVKIATLLILLIMIIAGTVTGGLNPLYEKIGGWFDRISLSLGRFSGNGTIIDASCREGYIQDAVLGVDGKLKACGDGSCYFTTMSPNELLGYQEFMLVSGRYKARKVDSEKFTIINYFENNEELFNLHRDSYVELSNIYNQYYFENKNDGESIDEFFEPIEFDSNAFFQIVISDESGETLYSWDGEKWMTTFSMGYGSYQGSYSPQDIEESEVFENVYTAYSYGRDVYWNYFGEKSHNILVENFNADYKYEKYTEDELWFWLDSKVDNITLSEEDKAKFLIEIDDFLTNTKYVFDGKKWIKDGFLFFNDRVDFDEVLVEILLANEKSDAITWSYSFEEIERIIITDEEVISRNDERSKKELKEWFEETRGGWTKNKEVQTEFLKGFSEYIGENTEVNVNNKAFPVKLDSGNDSTGFHVYIYFDVTEKNKFGLYLEDGEYILTFGEGIEESFLNDQVRYNDNEWEEFFMINEINKYLVDKCGSLEKQI